MKTIQMTITILLALMLPAGTALAAFESGSTCGAAFYNSSTCRGAYTAPTVNSTIVLPPNGILDYTSFLVPNGYTVTFTKNAANTPVVIRASSNVTISGIIQVGALTSPTDSGEAGNGNLGDDGQPGIGGPGGYDGGMGGLSPLFGGAWMQMGGSGKGPGGGSVAAASNPDSWGYAPWLSCGGGGAGFGSGGGQGNYNCGPGGAPYGQGTLLPLIGGSGGAGGNSGGSFNGGGGGGGGGAITIAASGTLYMGNASWEGPRIYANGSGGAPSYGSGCGGGGGGGSGGAIRLVADTLAMDSNAYLQAIGASGANSCVARGGDGGVGRIRLEANTITGWTVDRSNPQYSFGTPGHVFVPNNPTLAIASVTANSTTIGVPSNPTGNADISFPTGTTTATVNLVATGIPAGSTADVHVIPSTGAPRSKVLSSAFTNALTATATVTLSPGNNVLQAAVTYTITETVAMNLPKFNGEYVAKIRVEGGMNGKSTVTYITASGKEYPAAGGAKAKV